MPRLQEFTLARYSAAILMLCGIGAATVARADHADVQQQLFTALASSDIDGALALFTDDAVIDTESGLCAASPCVGKAQIRKDFERYVLDKSRRMTALDTYSAGKFMFTRFEARSAMIQKAGVQRIILWGMREMRGDKIASVRCCLPDRTDAQTEKFMTWENANGDK